ncbi:MAG: signal peptide peptidase SppA [Myxococcota bacterium]
MNRRGLVTIVAIFGGLFLLFFGFSVVMLTYTGEQPLGSGDNSVGVVEVSGTIMASKETVADIRKMAKDDSIKAMVIRIDSPGGAVAPSQEIFDAVRKAKEEKPLVASMGSTAASGGYYIAVGADKIYANAGTITGSIGVITQQFNASELLEFLELDVNTITTGPYKDAGSPFKEMTEQDRVYFRQLIDDIYEQFIEDVASGRDMELEAVRELADGRVYTGRQAVANKLVDELGTLQDAVDDVAKQAKIDGDVRVVYPPKEASSVLSSLLQGSIRGVAAGVEAELDPPAVQYRLRGF